MDILPAEMIAACLSFIPEEAPITRRVCREWAGVQTFTPQVKESHFREAYREVNLERFYWLMTEAVPSKVEKKHRSDFCALAAKQGNLPVLIWAEQSWTTKAGKKPWNHRTPEEAMVRRDVAMLNWLLEHSPPSVWDTQGIARAAVESGSLEMVEWIQTHLIKQRSYFWVAYYGAEMGNMEMLEYGYGDYGAENKEIFSVAAQSGHISVLKWLKQMDCPYNNTAVKAAGAGQTEVLRWLVENNYKYNGAQAIDAALASNQIEIATWLLELHPGASIGHLSGIYSSGNVEMAASLLAQGYIDRNWIHGWITAAEKGDIDMLQWLHDENFRYFLGTAEAAARKGHISVLEWMKKVGLFLNLPRLYGQALQRSQMEVIRWVCSNGLTIDEGLLISTLEKARCTLEMFSWLLDNAPSKDNLFSEEVALAAASGGRLNIFTLLIKSGCPWNKQQCLRACGTGKKHSALRNWLIEQNAPAKK